MSTQRFALSLSLLALACGDGDQSLETVQQQSSSASGADGGSILPCDVTGGRDCGDDGYCQDGRCAHHLCGDGRVGPREECDDGNQEVDDECTPSCRRIPPNCGDGRVQDGEACDDGNRRDGDECSSTCQRASCGDGQEDPDEECDDGNDVDTDDCSNVCTENRCRNGRIDPGEECDDGNQLHLDGCSNGCVVVACGNRRVEGESYGGSEECDDGNAVDDDACSDACTENVCGNLRLDPGEVCDGDTVELDCSDDCRSTSAGGGACAACRATYCAAFQGAFDLVGACYGNPDPAFVAQCTAVMDCAFENRCGYGDAGGTECFCGTSDLNACQSAGSANGPCQEEWYAAARTRSLADLFGRFGDVSLPSGVAFYFLECDRTSCPECLPQ